MPELPEVDPVVSFRDYLGQVARVLFIFVNGSKIYYRVETVRDGKSA